MRGSVILSSLEPVSLPVVHSTTMDSVQHWPHRRPPQHLADYLLVHNSRRMLYSRSLAQVLAHLRLPSLLRLQATHHVNNHPPENKQRIRTLSANCASATTRKPVSARALTVLSASRCASIVPADLVNCGVWFPPLGSVGMVKFGWSDGRAGTVSLPRARAKALVLLRTVCYVSLTSGRLGTQSSANTVGHIRNLSTRPYPRRTAPRYRTSPQSPRIARLKCR